MREMPVEASEAARGCKRPNFCTLLHLILLQVVPSNSISCSSPSPCAPRSSLLFRIRLCPVELLVSARCSASRDSGAQSQMDLPANLSPPLLLAPRAASCWQSLLATLAVYSCAFRLVSLTWRFQAVAISGVQELLIMFRDSDQ